MKLVFGSTTLDKKRLKKLISSNDVQINNNQFWIEHINISPNNFDFVFLS